jgi:hypothetical protein
MKPHRHRAGRALAFALPLAAAIAMPARHPERPAGAPAARVVHSVAISADEPAARHVESVLAVNPRDPKNLIAASIVLTESDKIEVYASRDGGRTWSRARQAAHPVGATQATRGAGTTQAARPGGATQDPGGETRFDGLDPAVAFDHEGTAYFLSIGLGAEVAVWKSSDGGYTWSSPAPVAGMGWDRPWITCMESSTAAFPERVFVAGKLPLTIFGEAARDIIGFSGSSDGGATFRVPRLFLPKPSAQVLNVISDLLVDARERIVLTLQLFPPGVVHDEVLAGHYGTVISEDGGRTFSPPRLGPEVHVYGHAAEGKSLFGLGGAKMAVDQAGGPYDGRLYLAWVDAVEGFYRVRVASSADGGATWSEPLFVGSAADSDASTPAVAVDGKGTVGVVWYDRRADATGGCYQLYFAASKDGGVSFSPAQLLDGTRTCPLGPREAAPDPLTSEYRFKNGGDTQGIVGMPGGGFQLAWIRAGEREMQLWSTSLEVP